jgi:hypothetical protein
MIILFYAGRAILAKWQKPEINTGKGFSVFDLQKCEQIVHIFRALTILVISKKFQKFNKRTIFLLLFLIEVNLFVPEELVLKFLLKQFLLLPS